MAQFTGKVALVTGASSGIGRAAAELLATQGASVVGCGLGDDLDIVGKEWEAQRWSAHLEAVDVTDEDAVAGLVARTADRFGGVDIVVTAAGIQRYGSAADTSAALWDEVFDVNVRGCFFATKHAIPYLRAGGGGSIVVVSSVQAFMNQSGVAAYTASKGALNALVRSIAIDEAPHRIRANSVCPASVDTPMLRASARTFSDGSDPGAQKLIDDWGGMHPMGRVATPAEVADAIAYLAGPHSAFITGIALPVDGGMLASAPVVLPS